MSWMQHPSRLPWPGQREEKLYMGQFDENKQFDVMDGYLTLQDRVYQILRDQILTGKLPPNAPLNTNRLSKQLNVSRTPIREAVNKLVSLGLAVKLPHREAKVADFMSDEMYEIFCARAALEGIAARSASRYMSNEMRQILVQLADRTEECFLNKDDTGFMEANQELHFLIYGSLKAPILQDMVKQLYMISQRNRETGYHLAGRSEQVVREHKELADAVRRGDGEEAERIGSRHHYNTIINLKRKFEMLQKENKAKN